MIDAILPVYKEKGYTSFDVVARLRGIFGQKRIGHTGTLDPDAQGVLVVAFGRATSLVERLMNTKKTYRARMKLGIETDTQDLSGEILSQNDFRPTSKQVEDALKEFEGGYMQTPPMFSALKQNGKRLYELARKGITVERKARRIDINNIIIHDFIYSDDAGHVDEIDFSVTCSQGTYIRTLIHDAGKKIGCNAAMKTLLRTYASGFSLDESFKLDKIEEVYRSVTECDLTVDDIFVYPEEIFANLTPVKVDRDFYKLLKNGNKLYDNMLIKDSDLPVICDDKSSLHSITFDDDNSLFRVYDHDGNFCAIYERLEDCLKLKYYFL